MSAFLVTGDQTVTQVKIKSSEPVSRKKTLPTQYLIITSIFCLRTNAKEFEVYCPDPVYPVSSYWFRPNYPFAMMSVFAPRRFAHISGGSLIN